MRHLGTAFVKELADVRHHLMRLRLWVAYAYVLRGVERDLNQDGYVTRRYAASYITPILHAIRLQDGKLDGGADPAGDGMAASC